MTQVKVRVRRYRQVAGAFGVSINRSQDEYFEGDMTDDEIDALRKQVTSKRR